MGAGTTLLLTLPTILMAAASFQNIEKTGHLCQKQIKALGNETLSQMFAASAKIVESFIHENIYQLGNFDQCINIVNETIYGKYCLGTLDAKSERFNLVKQRFGICVPSGCVGNDLEALVPKAQFSDDWCYSKDTEPALTVAAVVTFTILGIFLGIVTVATVCELMLQEVPIMVLAFLVLSNGRKLFNTSSDQDQLLCLNGIKAISMMWVILLHVYFNTTDGPLGGFSDIAEWHENVASMVIVNASVSVDSFFAVGGLVTVYTFLKTTRKGVKFNIFRYYLHRYLRLTPLLGIMVLIQATVLPYLGNGPLWNNIEEKFSKPCQIYWWSALLHVQNYFHGNAICLTQSWYVSVDFQLFLLSPLILIPLKRYSKICLTILGTLVLLSCILPFVMGFTYKLPAFLTLIDSWVLLFTYNSKINLDDVTWRYYKQTYTRFGPYVIGMITGYLIYNIKKKNSEIVLNRSVGLMVWFLSIGGMVACVFAPYSATLNHNVLSDAFIMAFMRNAWALSLSGLIFISVTGYGGVIDKFLSLPIFQFLTKLSYSMYLVHYSIISMRYASMRQILFLSTEYILWSFWGDFMSTLFFSFILTLTFESPIPTLEKLIFGVIKLLALPKHIYRCLYRPWTPTEMILVPYMYFLFLLSSTMVDFMYCS